MASGWFAAALALAGLLAACTSNTDSATPSPPPAPLRSPAGDPLSATDPETSAPSGPATYPLPRAGVDGPSWLMTHDGPHKWLFRDARTGARGRSGGPEGHEVTGIDALGDEKTFYFAARKTRRGGCGTSLLQRLSLRLADLQAVGLHHGDHAGFLESAGHMHLQQIHGAGLALLDGRGFVQTQAEGESAELLAAQHDFPERVVG